MIRLKELKKQLRKSIAQKWTTSFVYKMIDKSISKGFQRKLKNDDFTILCSNCIGGVIYNRLNKRFLSPTINIYIFQQDFISFCLNLDYYLKKELVFVESEYDCPVAELEGDGEERPSITILFAHVENEETARAEWERRKSRIRPDNLFIIMYKLDGVTVDQLRKLEQVPCRNKVVFTAEPIPEISWAYYIKPNMRHHYPYNYMQKNIWGERYFERKFDFVGFLNASGSDH
ncbi:MAG: DUF1919 domain-containing protein [Clostridiales bacterium]|nr:DUF1919 domain-containing protein [Clostridiales bacterium]